MKFRSVSRREKYLIYLCVTIILFFLFYNFIFKAGEKVWINLNKTILSKEVKLNKALQILPQGKRIEKEYDKFMDEFAGASSSGEEIVTSVLGRIELLARKKGVKINNMKPVPLKNSEVSYKISVIELDSVSQMEQLVQFIYDLEKPPSLLKVEKLELSLKNAKSNLLRARMTINGILFFD